MSEQTLRATGIEDTREVQPVRLDVLIGTKAQYIKTAPLLRLLDHRKIAYRLIDSGQHANLTKALRQELGVREPDICLSDRGDITTLGQALAWASRLAFLAIFKPGYLRGHVFSPDAGHCVIHGDTPTTLLSLLLAKSAGKKVAHLEAGLRSYNLLKPFPEELVRVITMHRSDILFTPSDWATRNARRMRLRGEIIELPQNTNVEAVYYSLNTGKRSPPPFPRYCIVTIHRVETVFSRRRLEFILQTLEEIAERRPVIFVLHEPTRQKLKQFGLDDRLLGINNVHVEPLMPHAEFLHLLQHADFVVTDGGSIQEESYYLDVPCLLMRTETERQEGMHANVRLAGFNNTDVASFLASIESLKTGRVVVNEKPSEIIARRLLGE